MFTLNSYPFIDLLEENGREPEDALHDVEFRVLSSNDSEEGKFKAHKMLLSLLSPVFKKQFYGKQRKRKLSISGNSDGISTDEKPIHTVDIHGHSYQSFTTFIKLLYSKDTKPMDVTTDVEVLFQIYILTDKYEIKGLKHLIRAKISSLKVSKDNYVEVFNTLRKYEKQFVLEEVMEELSNRCVLAVRKEWKTDEDVLKFLSENYEEDIEMKTILMRKLIRDVVAKEEYRDVVKEKCSNCKEVDCCDGQTVSKGWPGMRVKALVTLNDLQGCSVRQGSLGTVRQFNERLEDTYIAEYNLTFPFLLSVKWDYIKWDHRFFHNTAANIVYHCN